MGVWVFDRRGSSDERADARQDFTGGAKFSKSKPLI